MPDSLSSADLQFFVVVAKAGSVAAAARSLDVTVSAVSQRLTQLEARLGVRLVTRSSRRFALTDEGQLLATQAREIVDQLESLSEAVAERRGAVVGHLRIVAPFGFGRAFVAPAALTFTDLHPAVRLDLQLSDRLGRVPEATWDVAVHIGVLHDSSMIAHPLAPNDRVLCASPEYVATHGAPSEPHELRQHACLALRENEEDVTLWRFGDRRSSDTAVRIEPRLSTNDGEILRDWALAGRGIIVRSEWSVAADLRAGRLVQLLPDYSLPSANVVALVAPGRGRSARTARFLQHLRSTLTPAPWRE